MFFYDQDALIGRLVHTYQAQTRRVVFLLGSAITAPTGIYAGVPSTDEFVGEIRHMFDGDSRSLKQLEIELSEAGANVYQTAFRFLIGRRGIDAANKLIKMSVLRALCANIRDDLGLEIPTDEVLRTLEGEPKNWEINPSLRAVGRLVTGAHETFGSILLTSNFDPLISIAIQSAGGQIMRTALHADGNIGQTEGVGCHVVHFHGFWRQSDTLHTLQQISQRRPKLIASLQTLLQNAIVLTLGYGGWDDVFTRTLVQTSQDDSATPEILWCFRSEDQQSISERYQPLLNDLAPGLGRGRVNLYAGVDCHSFLPKLASTLGLDPSIDAITADPKTRFVPLVTGNGSKPIVLVGINFTRVLEEPLPSIDDWEGRSQELAQLDQTNAAVICISGMGGQGKSCLASYFSQRGSKPSRSFDAIEWRDCREEGHRINTAVASSILSLGPAGIQESDLENRSGEELVALLFRFLGNRRVLFVFDNVDHYINLATGEPQHLLRLLIAQALHRSHRSIFIFTSRPPIRVDSVRFCRIELEGLDREAARRLFEKKSSSARLTETELNELIRVTLGHPIWIATIAGWVSRERLLILQALDKIESGSGELPTRLLNTIWRTLNERQHSVLRMMAEMERAESEETLAEMVEGQTYQKFQQTLRVLKTLNLVQARFLEGSTEVLDLHPLVRHFIRTTFPKQERSSFITRVLSYLDRRFSKYLNQDKAELSRDFLEYEIQSIDLALNAGLIERALDAYEDFCDALLRRGLAEQCVRLGLRILTEIDWTVASRSFKSFDAFVTSVSRILVEADELEAADSCICKYEECIPEKGAQFINLCDLKCYRHWFTGDFEHSLHWGIQGTLLKERSHVDTHFDCRHNVALATRDSGDLNGALNSFLLGESLDNVLSSTHLSEKRGGPYYGNIGRCLQLKGDLAGALICYRKSARFLEDELRSSTLNRGYIRYWVGQVLGKQERWEDSFYVLISAVRQWRHVAPVRAASIEEEIEKAGEHLRGPVDPESVPDWKAENRFLAWLNSQT